LTRRSATPGVAHCGQRRPISFSRRWPQFRWQRGPFIAAGSRCAGGLPIIAPSLQPRAKETIMTSSLLPRALSLCLSLVVTFTMLVGIRGLSTHEEANARFAAMCAVARA
jgi:hypothetical protein